MVLNEVNQPQRNKFHRTVLAVCNQCSVGSNRIEWGHQQLEMERDNHLSYFDFLLPHDNTHNTKNVNILSVIKQNLSTGVETRKLLGSVQFL